MLQAWAALHGFTSLEAYGHLDWLTPEARDALFLSQVRLIAKTSGLPAPTDACTVRRRRRARTAAHRARRPAAARARRP